MRCRLLGKSRGIATETAGAKHRQNRQNTLGNSTGESTAVSPYSNETTNPKPLSTLSTCNTLPAAAGTLQHPVYVITSNEQTKSVLKPAHASSGHYSMVWPASHVLLCVCWGPKCCHDTVRSHLGVGVRLHRSQNIALAKEMQERVCQNS